MTPVTVVIPRMLATLIGRPRSIRLDAAVVADALEALFSRHPELRVHVLDESGSLREHVRCFHNDQPVAAAADWDRALADGDTVTILQAVSGG